MKKAFLSPLIAVTLFQGAFAQQAPLQATVSKTWTVDTAREEAFRDARPWVDVSNFQPVDPNLIENRRLMAQKKEFSRAGKIIRSITTFSNNTDYWVGFIHLDRPSFEPSYRYAANGTLNGVCYEEKPNRQKIEDAVNKYGEEKLFSDKKILDQVLEAVVKDGIGV